VREANESTDDPEEKKKIILEVVKASLRPELFNRLDDVICFNLLSQEVLEQIVTRNLRQLGRKLVEERNIEFEVDATAKAFLAKESYDPNYGARPVERTLQRLVLSPVAMMLIAQDGPQQKKIVVSHSDQNGGVRVEFASPKEQTASSPE
jgi:ATP-dependent Clp protease ATP-binding subunit ClpB